MNEVTACRSVLIEVLTILGKDLDKLVVVGGWVPELLYPNDGHIGSLDVDLALDARKLKPMAYESIRQKLIDSGYRQEDRSSNRFFRPIPGTPQTVKLDLITGEFAGLPADESHLTIQELSVWKAHGIDLAFEFQQDIAIDGTLPGGGRNRVTAKLPTVGAFVCIKAITLAERMKQKDAYDICFCVDHFAGGYRALALELRTIGEHPLIREGLEVLRDKFARIDSIGPVWAAQTADETGAGSGPEFEGLQRRAWELVRRLLEAIGGPDSPDATTCYPI